MQITKQEAVKRIEIAICKAVNITKTLNKACDAVCLDYRNVEEKGIVRTAILAIQNELAEAALNALIDYLPESAATYYISIDTNFEEYNGVEKRDERPIEWYKELKSWGAK